MPHKLPRCFFTLTIDGMPLGTIVFELCADICPKTCENFLCLCTGEKGRGGIYGKELSYRGSSFHRAVKGFMIQGGDFTHGTGVGGESIFGGVFPDENFILKHDQPFLLSMANRGPNTNGSQFFVTTATCPHLDNSHVVFGHVVEGEKFVLQIECTAVDTEHKPYADIRIIDCGEMPGNMLHRSDSVIPVAKVNPSMPIIAEEIGQIMEPDKQTKDGSSSESSSSSSDSSDSSSDSDDPNKKLRRKKKKLTKIKNKLDKAALKKKLKKSRAKKLKRIEDKLIKIEKLINGEDSSASDNKQLKDSFLYRSSVSPPKKKNKKKKSDQTPKFLDEAFFAKRGKIPGSLMAPMATLHGGVEEFSQTGPVDRITNIVNRSKTNVGPGVGGLDKAKMLGVHQVVMPSQEVAILATEPTQEIEDVAKPDKKPKKLSKKKQQTKKAKKRPASSSASSSPSSSSPDSSESEEEKKPKEDNKRSSKHKARSKIPTKRKSKSPKRKSKRSSRKSKSPSGKIISPKKSVSASPSKSRSHSDSPSPKKKTMTRPSSAERIKERSHRSHHSSRGHHSSGRRSPRRTSRRSRDRHDSKSPRRRDRSSRSPRRQYSTRGRAAAQGHWRGRGRKRRDSSRSPDRFLDRVDGTSKKKTSDKEKSSTKPGLRSKWSDDEGVKVIIRSIDDPTLEGRLGKMLQQQLTGETENQKNNNINADGAESVMLKEFSPKFTFG